MIRKMKRQDRARIIEMMRTFYASAAVLSNGSEEIFSNDVENCLNDSPYLEGYVFEENNAICGYAMLAKSFSTEYGKPCIWIEDLYIENEYRGTGLGTRFLEFVKNTYPDCLLRLEVELENTAAVRVYEKCGFKVLPYSEMIKGN